LAKLAPQALGSKAEPKSQRTEVEIWAQKTELEGVGVRKKEKSGGWSSQLSKRLKDAA